MDIKFVEKLIENLPFTTNLKGSLGKIYSDIVYDPTLTDLKEEVKPAFESRQAVCFACNETYAPYAGVAICSVIENADPDTELDFLILANEITLDTRRCILAMQYGHPNVRIRFLDVSSLHNQVSYAHEGSYITVEANYRLFLLRDTFKQYQRILYLDCDLIVLGNIRELLNVDLEGCCIGGIWDASLYNTELCRQAVRIQNGMSVDNYLKKYLCLKNRDSYFNSGVLVMDIPRCRAYTSADEAIKVLGSKEFKYYDQDALNIVFNESVKLLDTEWNYQSAFDFYQIRYFVRMMEEQGLDPKPYQEKVREMPKLVHYIGGRKPWDWDVAWSQHFYFYARKTMFYESIVQKRVVNALKKTMQECEEDDQGHAERVISTWEGR